MVRSKAKIRELLQDSKSWRYQPTSYGAVKRLGEQWVENLGNDSGGRIARLWNVYDYEPIGLKSHVIPDWIHACSTKGALSCFTDGSERRQVSFYSTARLGRSLTKNANSFCMQVIVLLLWEL